VPDWTMLKSCKSNKREGLSEYSSDAGTVRIVVRPAGQKNTKPIWREYFEEPERKRKSIPRKQRRKTGCPTPKHVDRKSQTTQTWSRKEMSDRVSGDLGLLDIVPGRNSKRGRQRMRLLGEGGPRILRKKTSETGGNVTS